MDTDIIDHRWYHVPEDQNGPTHDAVLLALKHINEAGGVWGMPVEVAFGNTFEDRTDRHAVARTSAMLDEEGAHVIVGTVFSVDVETVVEEVVKPRRVPYISWGTAPLLINMDDDGYHFSTVLNDEMQGFALARVANDEHDEHVAIAYQDGVWGRDLARVFKSHYNGRVSEVALHPEDDSFADELHELATSGAPVLVMMVFASDAHPVIEEVKTHGHFDHLLLISENRSLDLLADFPEFLDGSKGVAPIGRHIVEAEGHWEEQFVAEFGYPPSSGMAREVYDAIVVMSLAAESAGTSDGTAIRDALYEISRPPGTEYGATSVGVKAALEAVRNGEEINLEGEASAIDWDERGVVTVGHYSVWQFQDGGIVDIEYFDVDIRE